MKRKKDLRRPSAISILRAAVREVMVESLNTGLPFYVWRKGRVVALSDREMRSLLAKPKPSGRSARRRQGARG